MKYQKLFELITKQKTNDDAVLKEQVYTSNVSSSTFAEMKSYLYHFILTTLVKFEENNNIDIQLNSGLQKLHVLYKKGMIDAAQRLLAKLYTLATKNNAQLVLLKLKDWDRSLAYAKNDIDYLEAELEKINNQTNVLVEGINRQEFLKNAYYSLLVYSIRIKNSKEIDSETIVRINDLVKPLPDRLEHIKNYEEKKWWLNVKSFQAKILKNYKEYYKFIKLLFYLIYDDKHKLTIDARELIPITDKLIYSCISLDKLEESRRYIPVFMEISRLKNIGFQEKKKAVCSFYLNIVISDLVRGELDKCVERIKEFEDNYDPNFYAAYKVNVSIVFSQVYFLKGEYENATHWVNLADDEVKSLNRRDLQLLSRCLNLIIQYEIGNHLYLSSLIRSTNRLIQKKFATSDVEIKLMGLLRKLIYHENNKSAQLRLLKVFRQGLNVPLKYAKIRQLDLFNFTLWLDSKITGTSVSLLLKRQFAENTIEN